MELVIITFNSSICFGKQIPEADISEHKFCYSCGGSLRTEFIEGRDRKVCSDCGLIDYQNPVPSVAVIITDEENRLLLTRRSVEPGKGMWCLPGGFVEMGESPRDTVVRETLEETGLEVIPGEIIEAEAKINGFHGDVIIIGYEARKTGGELQAGDDAEEVQYFSLDEMPQIAFRSHRVFVEKYFKVNLIDQDEEKFSG